jgi:NAD(P)-dependent dehydrogenase (short-subunit alcohol dehydrogenase family)
MANGNYPTYPDLVGKVAVVSGGSRGIGAATCRLLAQNGSKVTVNGRDEAAINSVVEEIRPSGGEVIGVAADVTDFAAVDQMRRRVEEELGPVDVLAAFAGGQGYPTPTEQMAEEQWRSVIDSNLTATFLTVRSFLPGMIERRRGSIVTMASSAGRLPSQASAAYAAAKAGVVMFSRHVANEVGQHGVRVNCLAPSSVLTERVKRLMPENTQQQVATTHPLGRMGAPEDVAMATLFLASESSSWITGVTLDVAGGRVII